MELSPLRESNFEYGALARGIYIVMLWAVWIFVFVAPVYLIYYVPLLLFLGLGLKPFLIRTGLFTIFNALESKRSDKHNEELKKGYYIRNAKKIEERDKHIEEMRKKMITKD